MTSHLRRYVFLDFDTLRQLRFKKLEKVCDKIFVFISSELDAIPFTLVKDMQRMGTNVKWIEVEGASQNDLNYHICFLMGKLHEKISGDVEFAILSNDLAFDPLVNFINSTGRSCIRVRQQGMEAMPENGGPYSDTPIASGGEVKSDKPLDLGNRLFSERGSAAAASISGEGVSDPTIIEETAKETVRRLIRSGNRPAELGLLKNYILLHNQELSLHGNLEKIIKKLEESNEIRLNSEQVVYNF
jgi:PIN domain